MSKHSLLLADDSITIQKVVNLTFADEGYEVRAYGDGDSAMSAILEQRPDIVLADVNMPGQDGYLICEELRQNDATRDLPVILLVGSFEPFDGQRAAAVGANAYLTKPFQSIRQLVEQVNELVAAAQFGSTNGSETAEVLETAADVPQDDIATLYSRSFGETSGMADDSQTSSSFDDGGLDDEMIETSYLANDESLETVDFEIESNSEESEQGRSETAPLIDQYYPASEDNQSYRAADEFPDLEETIQFDEPSRLASFDGTVETSEKFVPMMDVEPESWEGETISVERETVDFVDDPLEVSADNAYSTSDLEESLLEEVSPSQMGIETFSFAPPVEESKVFQEIDLLDIPPIGGPETVELTTAERAEIMGSDKQVLSLSPELMEVIVQKVVERLSQKY